MGLVREMYESYSLERYDLVKVGDETQLRLQGT